jgi:hypothetical protein
MVQRGHSLHQEARVALTETVMMQGKKMRRKKEQPL